MNSLGFNKKGSLPDIRGDKSKRAPPKILLNRASDDVPKLKKISYDDLIANARMKAADKKKKKDKSKKKVRLLIPEDITPAPTPDRINPFENNWLVDTPRDILREKTVLHPEKVSKLQEELQGYHDEVAMVPIPDYQEAGKAARELVRFLQRRFNKMEFKNGLKLETPVFAGSTFDDTQAIELTEIDLLLPFELHSKHKIESLQPGYPMIGIPRLEKPEKPEKGKAPPPPVDPYEFGRSEDGTYLSARIVSWTFYALIEKLVISRPNTNLQPYTINEGSSQIVVTINDRFNIHIIPAAWDARLEAYLVTRPYLYDDNPFSDMMWRYCFTQDEQMLFKTMESADRGSRTKCYRVLKALTQTEHTLEGLTSYQIKSVFLHMFDADIDNTPRWQRGDMETMFMNVLKELKHYFVRRNLPHFFLKSRNLLDNMPDRTWTNLKNRISFLASNPRECARILRKRSRLQINKNSGRLMTSSVTSTQTV